MKRKVNEPESVKMLKEAFKVFDPTGKGIVSRDFLMMSFMKTGQTSMAEIEEMLDALDTNNDGNIELEDFLKIVIDKKPKTKTSKSFLPNCCFL